MPNRLPISLSNLLDTLQKYAIARIDETGLLTPLGMTKSADGELSVLVPVQVFEQSKGLPPNTQVRMLQDMVANMKDRPPSIGILYGADLVPVEGGDNTTALVGWLEDSAGFAAQVVTPCEIREDSTVLGEHQVIPRKPILLSREKVVPRPDIGRGRFGNFDIRPRVNFRAPDLTIEEAADLLLLLALASEREDEDWNTVSATGIDKNRFLFERACLRSAAAVISLIHIDSDAVRHNVEVHFWDKMALVTPNINSESQVYFQAFPDSERLEGSKLVSEFSVRCTGTKKEELVSFAQKSFGTLMVVCSEFWKKNSVKL
jgi:hypothetical protein